MAGAASSAGFAIYDNACIMRAAYFPTEQGNNCGTPYNVHEDFLHGPLQISAVNYGSAATAFTFSYLGNTVQTGKGNCHCKDSSKNVDAGEICSCPFLIGS